MFLTVCHTMLPGCPQGQRSRGSAGRWKHPVDAFPSLPAPPAGRRRVCPR